MKYPRSHPWRRVIRGEIEAVKAAKRRRPRPVVKGRAYASVIVAELCAARGGKDLY